MIDGHSPNGCVGLRRPARRSRPILELFASDVRPLIFSDAEAAGEQVLADTHGGSALT